MKAIAVVYALQEERPLLPIVSSGIILPATGQAIRSMARRRSPNLISRGDLAGQAMLMTIRSLPPLPRPVPAYWRRPAYSLFSRVPAPSTWAAARPRLNLIRRPLISKATAGRRVRPMTWARTSMCPDRAVWPIKTAGRRYCKRPAADLMWQPCQPGSAVQK